MFFECKKKFSNLVNCLNKQNMLQINEILILKNKLVNAYQNFTYALSTSKVKVTIYQSFN